MRWCLDDFIWWLLLKVYLWFCMQICSLLTLSAWVRIQIVVNTDTVIARYLKWETGGNFIMSSISFSEWRRIIIMLEFDTDVSDSSNSTSWHHGFLSLLLFPLCMVNSEARRSGSFHFCGEYFNNLLCGWWLFCFLFFFLSFFFFPPLFLSFPPPPSPIKSLFLRDECCYPPSYYIGVKFLKKQFGK